MAKMKAGCAEPDNDDIPMEYPKGKGKRKAPAKKKARKGGMGMHLNAKHVGKHS